MASGGIKGITIEIGGDTTELQRALQKPEQNARSLQKELREINNSLKFNPESLELLAQKSSVLGEEIVSVSEKLKILKDSQAQVQSQAASGEIGEEQFRAFNRELERTASQLSELKSQLAENGRQIQDVGQSTGEAAKNSEKYQKAVREQKDAIEKAKDSSKEHGKALKDIKQDYDNASNGALSFGDAVKATAIGKTLSDGIQKAASALWDFASAGADAAREFEVNERKLELVLKNTTNATDDYIASVRELILQEERLGVVSANAQTAAAQELATYVTKRGTLEKLIPVLNDMIAQQYGVNASQEAAVSVATALGKTLDGQVGSLQRWGYRFSEAEQNILKTGTEARKLRVIVDSVTDSVGGLSYGLRETTEEGRRFADTLELEKTQQKFGKDVEKIKNSIMSTLLPSLTQAIDVIDQGVVQNATTFENLGNILATVINVFANLLKILASIPAPVLVLVGGIALAVKTFSAAEKGLGAFNGILKLFTLQLDPTTVKILALVAAVSVLLFLILSLKEGTKAASASISSLGNAANNFSSTNVNAAKPRGYASGTRSAARGLAWVGEEGPELVNFRGGERVFTARQSAQLATAGAYGAIPTQQVINNYDNRQVTVARLERIDDLVYQDDMKTVHARAK